MDSTPRPAKKRRKQRKPWYRGATASQMILEHVIRTPITRILLEGVASKRDLLEKLEKHLLHTGSARARWMLEHFDDAVNRFWLMKPKALTLDSLLKD